MSRDLLPEGPPLLPEWALRLLEYVLPETHRWTVPGDFAEVFSHRVVTEGWARAWWAYVVQVGASLPAFFLTSLIVEGGMLRNYWTVAVRNISRYKGYSGITVAGLAVGMACVLLILMYIQDEWSYDRFHEHAEHVYRVTSEYGSPEGVRAFARAHPAAAPTLLDEFAEVEYAVRLLRSSGLMQYEDRQFQELGLFFADSSAFDVFTFPMIQGDPQTALNRPNTVALTETTAERYFGTEPALGKVLTMDDTLHLEVTAVIEDIPQQSHLDFDMLISMETWKQNSPNLDEAWFAGVYYTYVRLNAEANAEGIQAQIPAYLDRQGRTPSNGSTYLLRLQPLTDIHLRSALRQEFQANGNISNLYVFGAIAGFILLISCINFMNLATARSTRRAKEVGVRKALGAERMHLVRQFLSEALLLSGLATALALGVLLLALPAFNVLTGKTLAWSWATHGAYIGVALGLAVVVGLAAGSYPAFLLASFRPVVVLKGTLRLGGQRVALWLRKGLVVVQFAISIFIIAGTVIVANQVSFLREQNLGFDAEQIVVIPFHYESAVLEQYPTLKERLLQQAVIQEVTASGDVPGRMFTSLSYWAEGMEPNERRGINGLMVDPDFAEVYGLEVIAGRDFAVGRVEDEAGAAFVLNETAVAELGWTPEEAIGKSFRMNREGTVIGVVEDFHFDSLQKPLEAIALNIRPGWFGHISARVNTSEAAAAVETLEATWNEVLPSRPFSYFFLDDAFNQQYQAEERFGRVFMTFALLAIFISCLGLLGLASYTAEQRTKEVGVRKVLGASMPSIIGLLVREFVVLIGGALLVATPLAYLAMHHWLSTFAYHTDIGVGVFMGAGGLALVIALVTVGYHTVRTALANPVNALRYE